MLDTTQAYGLTCDSGEFARAELDLLLACAARTAPGAYLDVGGNIGALALPFAARRPEWRVLAVEAHPGLSSVLAQNARANGLGNVEVVQSAAGASVGSIEFPSLALSGHGNFGMLRIGMDRPTQSVPLTTLDVIAPSDTRLVKVDVEGFEAEVFKGAQRLVREVRPAWVFEVSPEREAVARACLATMLEASYRLFWFYAPFVLPEPMKGAVPFDRKQGDLNVLALPGDALDWALTEIGSADAPWPTYREAMSYIRRYL